MLVLLFRRCNASCAGGRCALGNIGLIDVYAVGGSEAVDTPRSCSWTVEEGMEGIFDC